MDMIADAITRYGAWLWFVVAVVLMVLETIVPGIHFLWFGVAAGVVGLLALVAPIAWQWQVILFTLFSAVTVLWVRRSTNPDVAKTDEPVLNVRGAQYIGRAVTVENAIQNGRGRVRVGDTIWPAEGEDAPKGASVTVTGVNGTVLVVSTAGDDE